MKILFILSSILLIVGINSNQKIHTIKLDGNITLLYYYLNIYVGTPP